MIGPSTQILGNAQILASTLGAKCVVGENTVVRNSYLFDGVVVGANCVIEHSIIGAGVHIGDGTRIPRGCLVADGINLGVKAHLKPFERVSRRIEDGESEEGDEEDKEEDGEDAEGSGSGEETEGSDDESEEDSEYEEAAQNQPSLSAVLGKGSNGFVWPRRSANEEDEARDEVETFNNLRLMRIGDDYSDLELSDPGSITSSEDEDSSDDDDSLLHAHPSSSSTSLGATAVAAALSAGEHAAESEFKNEVRLSLERAFTEEHSLDNASVELKTLRMASNVPLRRVREAVVSGIVERIEIVDGVVPQRAEIKRWIDRWGELINKIGGIDGVDTVAILQAHCARSERMPLFGQILAALYQNDIVEEDDIRGWHKLPESKGEGLKPGPVLENMQKSWIVGARMIHQFDEQESTDEDEDGEDSEEASDDDGAEDEESEEED
ncbi:hypothetical protein EVG20_g2649 [Dentipellis fragilis]|uniref:W2 domain-containing protein n=1 Tax=Dentipellis fragilis TaxID=205917 RepID=A0A4Y9Z8D6_9AGAM|nr:hypothetical protein EVG20_g2649 [Dentipellis fragilis]